MRPMDELRANGMAPNMDDQPCEKSEVANRKSVPAAAALSRLIATGTEPLELVNGF